MNRYFLFFMLCTSCSSMYIFVDSDKSADVTKYEGYSWSEIKNIENNRNPIYYNELNDKRIKAAVNEILVKKGYKEMPVEPCFVLHYHIVVGDIIAYRSDPEFSRESTPWMRPMVPYERYKEGSLIFDVMDLKANSLIWRGYASQILVADNTPLTEENIKEAVRKIFAKFPARHVTSVAKSH